MENKKLTEEFIYKCEKQRKKNEKKLKPLTRDDIMKYEIADELGLLDMLGFNQNEQVYQMISYFYEFIN